ncbi:MAG: hypothetical protein ICV54_08455 [Nostoc sp. C3-bin3]|nr:hypothetical protein [Nostoc sp. C3-bin3]
MGDRAFYEQISLPCYSSQLLVLIFILRSHPISKIISDRGSNLQIGYQ